MIKCSIQIHQHNSEYIKITLIRAANISKTYCHSKFQDVTLHFTEKEQGF